jgi:hypothetical protein
MGFRVFHDDAGPDEFGNGDEYEFLPDELLAVRPYAKDALMKVYSPAGWAYLEADAGHEPVGKRSFARLLRQYLR